MTRNITIANPSPKLVEFFELMRARKEAQQKKMGQKKESTFKVVI